MGLYIFKHPKKEKFIEVYQGMNDVHEYFDKKGLKWGRVYTVPTMSVDSKINEFSQEEFVSKTKGKKGTVGDLMDRSKELSEKRANKNGGVDPVKEKFFKDYAKKRKGKLHQSDPKRYAKLNKLGGSFE